jgi:hypothetical protein
MGSLAAFSGAEHQLMPAAPGGGPRELPVEPTLRARFFGRFDPAACGRSANVTAAHFPPAGQPRKLRAPMIIESAKKYFLRKTWLAYSVNLPPKL